MIGYLKGSQKGHRCRVQAPISILFEPPHTHCLSGSIWLALSGFCRAFPGPTRFEFKPRVTKANSLKVATEKGVKVLGCCLLCLDPTFVMRRLASWSGGFPTRARGSIQRSKDKVKLGARFCFAWGQLGRHGNAKLEAEAQRILKTGLG